jgi:hypothetical protein
LGAESLIELETFVQGDGRSSVAARLPPSISITADNPVRSTGFLSTREASASS